MKSSARWVARGLSFVLCFALGVVAAQRWYVHSATDRSTQVVDELPEAVAGLDESAWLAAKAEWEREREKLIDENYRLTGELENALVDRVAREEDFMRFTQALSDIVPPNAPPEVMATFIGRVPPKEVEPAPVANPLEQARKDRSEVLARKLRALLKTERIDSLDLLEAGLVGDGYMGPVVFRTLDDRGRPVGTLSADRLHLEGSRAGRTLTLVLESGYERRDGKVIPFEGTQAGEERGGLRRIFLQQADPGPWFDACRELFGEENLAPLRDDGRWHVFLVHRRLNDLLVRDTEMGYYRLSALGGILDSQLRDVEVEQLDKSGRLIKRLFADRLTISLEERGVLLLLQDGIQMQGGRKFDYLGGRYRIFLPSANQDDWKDAGLPGLVPSKESSAGSQAPLSIDGARR